MEPRIGEDVYFASESPENQRLLLAAMERECRKWEEHKATLPLTQGELSMLKSRFPNFKIVGTRWVLTPKGCQEDPSMMRTDSPTGSRDSFSWLFLAQHKNIGVVVLQMPLLHICKQEE